MIEKSILIGLTYYFPNVSGVSVYAVILAEELVKRKYVVKIITSQHKKNLKTKEGNITRIPGFGLGKGFIMPMYWLKSYSLVKGVEIVNCHLPSIESVWLAWWAKILKKKLIVTHHCEFGFNGPISNRVIAAISYPIHFLTYLMADKIVAYTEDYANHSMFLKLFKKKVVFILPPIKIEKSKDKRAKIKEKIVGFVGRIAWEKGLDVLVEAMENIDAKLMLVGPYEEVAGDKTYKKLKKIELVGPIDHEKLNKYYKMFDCLVLPSTNNLETFGIVQAEAMLCGCPVVASNLPGVRVPVRMTGMGRISKIGDAENLAEQINYVLTKGKPYFQKKATNLDKFDYLKTVDEYEKCFK